MDGQNQPNLRNPLSTGSVGGSPLPPGIPPASPPPLRPSAPPLGGGNAPSNFPRPSTPPMPPRPAPLSGSPTPPPPMPPRPMPPRPMMPPPPPGPKIMGESASAIFGSPRPPMPEVPKSDKVPPPPAPEVNIRSLESDLASLKASGGVSPAPRKIKLDELPGSAIPTGELPGGISLGNESSPRTGFRAVLKLIGTIAVVIGVGFLGYYVIYPALFPAPGGALPPVSNTSVPPASQPVTQVPHASLFVTAPPVKADVSITSLTIGDIIVALQGEAQNVASAGTLKEVAISNATGQLPFSQYITVLAPSLNPADISAVVDDDFSGFLFYNAAGVWPGYVARLKSGVAPSDAERVFAGLESSDVRSFYVAEPGTHGAFGTGPYKGAPVRFAKFTQPGASFNYGVIGNYVVISSSFDGLKSAVDYLGL